jgi:hypothetical protein
MVTGAVIARSAKGAVMVGRFLATLGRWLVVGLLMTLTAGGAFARDPIPSVNTENGLAIKGYDPVAYFADGRARPGSPQVTATYNGAVYRFTSTEHRDLFLAGPERYLPQYGGYCAYAISLNLIADIEPYEWTIVGGKLYLNNGFFAQKLWSLDKTGNIAAGDRYWPLVPKLPD